MMSKLLSRSVPVFFLVCFFQFTKGQNQVTIPAYTAYLLPADSTDDNGDSRMLSSETGLHDWTDPAQRVQFFFKVRTPGMLELSIQTKNVIAGSVLSAEIAGKKFKVTVPSSPNFKKIRIGTVQISDTGFYSVELKSARKKGRNIADIQSLQLSGTSAAHLHYNPVARRNAASVHLLYPLDDSVKTTLFYNEITVPENADPLYSYYEACGFSRGYLGMQVNSPTERRIIFSVWDAGNEPADRNKVAEENKVKLMAKGENVFADGFGNEGTGGHSHFIYPWKPGVTYRFLVTAATDSASATTSYAGYFFMPELQKWKLIACFKAPKDGKSLRKLYAFVENFEGSNGQLLRKAFFSSPWIRTEKGDWKSLTKASFSYDATGKAGNRIDYGGGVNKNRFYLWNGGFSSSNTHYGEIYEREPDNEKPGIDLYSNADSALEAEKEAGQIDQFISVEQLKVTGNSKGVIYQVTKEGNGDLISINDTLVVHYKGSLLNGNIFDQSKETPAVFPLKRLIKGWQQGLLFCRPGGSIRLIIPSYLAYSIRNLGVIPPNSPLVFDIDVVEVRKGRP